MWQQFRIAGSLFLCLTLLTGVAYPVVITLVAQIAFSHQANGSIIQRNGIEIGSEILGQSFSQASYFWGRPSSTGPVAYNAMAGSGSNLACSNPALITAIGERTELLRRAHPDQVDRPIPVDLVTASASGLDPHISPAAAKYQLVRVATARGIAPEDVRKLIAQHTETPLMACIGQPRVNVLRLNLALDAAAPPTTKSAAEK